MEYIFVLIVVIFIVPFFYLEKDQISFNIFIVICIIDLRITC